MKKVVHWALILILCLFVFRPVPGLLAGSTPRMIDHTLNQTLGIQLPPSMQLSENPLREREQLFYSVYLNDDELSLRGYIQVWQLNDVEIFLANSKETSPFDFYSYSVKPITSGKYVGLVHEWGASFGTLSKISGKEYWLKAESSRSSEVLRIAFLTSNLTLSNEQLQVINQILASLRWG